MRIFSLALALLYFLLSLFFPSVNVAEDSFCSSDYGTLIDPPEACVDGNSPCFWDCLMYTCPSPAETESCARACAGCCTAGDSDEDCNPDILDNCPDVWNPDQTDANNNLGDACDGSGTTTTTTSAPLTTTTTVPGNTTTTIGPGTTTVPTTTVPESLIVDFTADSTSGLTPFTVQFTNQCKGNIASYLWNFGDGNTSTDPDPAHTYMKPGKYSVSLQAYTYSFTSALEGKIDYIVVNGLPCILESTLTDQKDLDTLRTLRNSMISKNIVDRILTFLYYKNSAEVTMILDDNPGLRAVLRSLITDNISLAHKLAIGEAVTVSQDIIGYINVFLNELKTEGSSKLKNDIDFVIKGIENKYLLNGLLITVE